MTSNDPATDPVLTVVVNGQAVIEYDRRKPLAPRQQLFLDRMDQDMDGGIGQDGNPGTSPDLLARARFVANSLLQALDTQNDSVAAATCAYLAVRLPELKQVRADSNDGQLHIDLVFDSPYVPVQTVQFIKPPGKNELH
jgi:hypothetical protein